MTLMMLVDCTCKAFKDKSLTRTCPWCEGTGFCLAKVPLEYEAHATILLGLPAPPRELEGTLRDRLIAEARAARFAQHIRHVHTVSPGKPWSPPPIIAPSSDVSDFWPEDDIGNRYRLSRFEGPRKRPFVS
jgi:hypothetical protein